MAEQTARSRDTGWKPIPLPALGYWTPRVQTAPSHRAARPLRRGAQLRRHRPLVDALAVMFRGRGVDRRHVKISLQHVSQFALGLLPLGRWGI